MSRRERGHTQAPGMGQSKEGMYVKETYLTYRKTYMVLINDVPINKVRRETNW
jgi:hypothetical protein